MTRINFSLLGYLSRTHGTDGMLQLVTLHRSTVVPVVRWERGLPAIQNLGQFLELIEAHHAWHVPLRLQTVKVHIHGALPA